MAKEDKIQAEIVNYFNISFPNLRTCLVRLKNEMSTTYDIALGVVPGAADLLLTFGDQRFCWIEVKAEKGTQSDKQKAFEKKQKEIGNSYYVVKSLEDFIDVLKIEMSRDEIVEKTRKDLHTRSQAGIKKYGTTLAGNKGDHLYWLQHAYEEALDMALYLKRAIEEGKTKTP
jgi:hypothetical protein